jgi:hypothetical protein
LKTRRFNPNSRFQFPAVRICQVFPSAQQQPFIPFDEASFLWPLPEELCPPHFIDRIVGVLQHVKLVIDDLALRGPLPQAFPEWFPHVHARCLDPLPLATHQLAAKELIQRLLLPLLAEPQRLARLQIAHHRQKLVLLALVDLIDTHLSQRWLPPPRFPSLQVPQIDGPDGALCQPNAPGHLPRRRTLARLSHRILESLAVGCLARQQLHLLRLYSAVWAANPIEFDDHRRL